ARALRVLRILDGNHAAYAGDSVTRGEWLPDHRVQRRNVELRDSRQQRALLGGSLLPGFRLDQLRSNAQSPANRGYGLEPDAPVCGCHGLLLARMGRQLRRKPSACVGRGRDAREPFTARAGAALGADSLCGAAEKGAARTTESNGVAERLDVSG